MGPRSLQAGAATVLAMMVTGMTFLTLAMARYPGGTELDPHSAGHSFWLNFLCDLMRERALNGASNAASRAFAHAGMAAFAVGLGAFWLILPAEFARHRAVASTVRFAGGVSVLGFLAAPVAAGGWHAVALFAAAGPGVLAAIVGLVATVRYLTDKVILAAALGSIATVTIDSILYARWMADGFRSCTPALPVFQRLTALFVLLWAGKTAWRTLRSGKSSSRRGIPPAETPAAAL